MMRPVDARVDVNVQPVRRAYEQVADQLRGMIASGSLKPGARLPLENELARDFGVSRATVREALRALSAQQLIRTSKGPGGGNFVTLPTVKNISEYVGSSLALLTEAQTVTLEEFLEVRELVEVRAARLAALRRSEADLARLQAAIPPEPHRPWTPEQYAFDRGFHAGVVAASGNALLQIAAQPIFSVLQEKFERPAVSRKMQRGIDEQHRELAAAIAAADAPLAEETMRAHLDYLRPAYESVWRERR
jgi:DNA-binding FadR family transcriptional regulator